MMAAISRLAALVDLIIFCKIIDAYVVHLCNKSDPELISGVPHFLGLVVAGVGWWWQWGWQFCLGMDIRPNEIRPSFGLGWRGIFGGLKKKR